MKIPVKLMIVAFLLIGTSCKKNSGCTDSSADNYDYNADVNDGSCEYSGQVMFYISSAYNYVDVNCNGSSKTITLYYPSGATCGAAGCATYEFPTGTYTYYAEEQGILGDTWSGSVTITKNGCAVYLLP